MIGIKEIIGGAIKPLFDLIDSLHTSKEEKEQAKAAILGVQASLLTSFLEHESKVVEAQSKVLTAEITGHSWMQRNWRPIIMLSFGFIPCWNYVIAPLLSPVCTWIFGAAVPVLELPTELWEVLKWGITGYIGIRGAEKITQMVVTKGQRPSPDEE